VGPVWAHAFAVAALLTLAGTPLLRRVALSTEFVDQPVASHKSHRTPTPYLGGIGLIVAVLLGLLFTARLSPQVGVIALGGSVIGCLGLVDDHRSVGALFRFVVELAVAVCVLSADLRINATDIPVIDGVITVLWIVGVTNATNLLDNMDGLAAGVSAAAAGAIFALAVLAEQPITATIAAALAGASIGFLVHNKQPASIFMGDTGSLFLGFALAVVTIDVSPALRPPASFAVPLMLLALPVLDTATVTLSRLRRGRSISQGGKDHLSHRLEGRGLSRAQAVRLLVATEVAVGFVAVLAGRDVLPLGLAVLLAASVLAGLSCITASAAVYTEPVVGLPRPLRLGAAAAVAVLIAIAAPAAVALARAEHPGSTGATLARAGVEALAAGDAGRAASLFDEARTSLARAERILAGRLTSLGLILPGVRANVATARAVVDAGLQATAASSTLTAVVDAANLPLGAPDAAARARALAPALTDAASVLQESASQLAGYDRPYLWPALGRQISELRAQFAGAAATASTAADAARLLPAAAGADAPRHYFLAVLDNAELRGSGGVPRYWGEIIAEKGRLRLVHVGPIEELDGNGPTRSLPGLEGFTERYRQFDVAGTWQNVTVSPDFAVTGQVITSLYAQTRGTTPDGVIAVDVSGLAGLLDVTGPVTVAGWPEPVSSGALADVMLRDVFTRYPDDQDRLPFMVRLVDQVVRAFVDSNPGTPGGLVGALAAEAHDGHLALYAERPEEQQLFERLGAAGRPTIGAVDSLFVVNQNLSGAGLDASLHRSISYDVNLDPGRGADGVTGTVSVTLRNDAPSTGLPRSVIGPYDERFRAGENRTLLSIYSPLRLAGPRTGLVTARELGLWAHSSTVAIPSKDSRSIRIDLEGRLQLEKGNWYRLNLPHQPSLTQDQTVIRVSVPRGWRLTGTRGMERIDARHAVATLSVSGPESVAVRIERTAWSRLWSSERG
jgi:UDP-GlcNAc:undecaprenyl-phosphate/decaprenyl-phosphate GlcNAc-1-phosphate transferase